MENPFEIHKLLYVPVIYSFVVAEPRGILSALTWCYNSEQRAKINWLFTHECVIKGNESSVFNQDNPHIFFSQPKNSKFQQMRIEIPH